MLRLLLLVCVLAATPAFAQSAKKGGKAAKQKPAAQAPAAPVVEEAPAATAAPASDEPPGALVARAQERYDQLEYDQVAPLAARALAHPAITLDEKLSAYQLQGSALAIVGDPIEAERPFLLLLSVDPAFDLPKDTPPKIRSVFSKVKGEFGAVREAQVRREREALAATIEVSHRLPDELAGGRPLRLDFRVKDPKGAIKAVRVEYRRQGDPDFIGLPLQEAQRGRWLGAVPAEWTASGADHVLELTASFLDDVGSLKTLGSREQPLPIRVTAGQVVREPPVPLWAFGTSAGVAVAATVFAAGTTGATAWLGADFQDRLARATPESPASGAEIVATQRLGESLNLAAVVGWAVTGAAVVTTTALGLFTNWGSDSEDETREEPAPPPASATAQAGVSSPVRIAGGLGPHG
jgi:hypothetical protein